MSRLSGLEAFPDGQGMEFERGRLEIWPAGQPLSLDALVVLIVRQTVRGTSRGPGEYARWVYMMAEELMAEGRKALEREMKLRGEPK